jgi:hypothetical protein
MHYKNNKQTDWWILPMVETLHNMSITPLGEYD